MLKRPVRFTIFLTLAWFCANLLLILASWGRSYFADISASPQVIAIDMRADKNLPSRVVTIIATRPTPSKADYLGHMWIAWPASPPLAPIGTKEGGYYAKDQLKTAFSLAGAIWAPWGFLTGQQAQAGMMKADDGWWRHVQIDVTVDEAHYLAALAVDTRWRRETRYSLRPGMVGFGGAGRTWACQDYVFEVAAALGLKADQRNWTQFPMGSFLDFAKANGLEVNGR
jgi:hypothetical protein